MHLLPSDHEVLKGQMSYSQLCTKEKRKRIEISTESVRAQEIRKERKERERERKKARARSSRNVGTIGSISGSE